MTSWQDQPPRQPGNGTAQGPAQGAATVDPRRPLSRREARERERQAAEALSDGREHPSGVVDFDGYDFDPEFQADQEIAPPDTADIWAALTRRSQHPGDRVPPAAPAPAAPPAGHDQTLPPVTDDLMDRIRGAVLRREREPESLPTAIAPIVPAAPQAPAPAPSTELPSRRALRREEAARTNEDGMPTAWFSDPGPATPAVDVPPALGGARPVDFDDLPPTIAMPMPALDRADIEARAPMTAPVGLPGAHAGNDALAFSSRPPAVLPTPSAPAAAAEAAFVEPVTPWAERHQAWSEPAPAWNDQPSWDQNGAEPWGAQQESEAERTSPGRPSWTAAEEEWDAIAPQAASPWDPAQPPRPWQQAQQPAQPQGDRTAEPYSEPTDLAGFEALIKRARSGAPQPMPQTPQTPGPGLEWQEPDDREQSAFARAVAAPHGSSNSLVLPMDPTPDLTQAVNSTGDIFITGSMKLPRSLSTTGATEEHFDGPDVDRLFEAAHNEPAAGVAPVRASRAIAGTPAGRPIVGRRSRANVLPTVLAVVAGAMALGVLVLLVGSWVLNLW